MSAEDLRLLTIPEVADRLGVKERTVYRLIEARDLRVTNVGIGKPRMRVRIDDLAAFIEARTVDGPKPVEPEALIG